MLVTLNFVQSWGAIHHFDCHDVDNPNMVVIHDHLVFRYKVAFVPVNYLQVCNMIPHFARLEVDYPNLLTKLGCFGVQSYESTLNLAFVQSLSLIHI